MLHLANWTGLWAVAVLISACALEEPPDESTTESSLCSIFFCGDNAATGGDGLLFDEFDLFGDWNYAGVRLLGARWVPPSGGTSIPLTLDIQRHALSGIEPGGWRREGGALVGTIIKLEYSAGGKSEIFEILIDGYTQVQFLAGAMDGIPAYLMKARRQGEKKFDRYVCDQKVLTADPYWAETPRHALVYRGDRYDRLQKRVIADNDPNNGWSFIACAGSAGAKMHVFRHTHAGGFDLAGDPSFMRTPDERTILLKTITADYCGNGSTFTVNGEALAFTASTPFTMPALPPRTSTATPGALESYEAIWSADGAVCIDTPRLAGVTAASITATCGRTIPSCGFATAVWPWYGYAITGNPW